jgi:hypothetical protein
MVLIRGDKHVIPKDLSEGIAQAFKDPYLQYPMIFTENEVGLLLDALYDAQDEEGYPEEKRVDFRKFFHTMDDEVRQWHIDSKLYW